MCNGVSQGSRTHKHLGQGWNRIDMIPTSIFNGGTYGSSSSSSEFKVDGVSLSGWYMNFLPFTFSEALLTAWNHKIFSAKKNKICLENDFSDY